MRFRYHITFVLAAVSFLLFPVLSGNTIEKLTDAELRNVTGQSGFINSEEDLEKLESARNTFQSLIRSQGLGSLLSDSTRNKLFDKSDLEPDQQAKLLQKTTRELLKNPKFLKQIEQAGRALVELSKALSQLNNLQ